MPDNSTRRFVDLHTHSTASDGSACPADLVRLADQARLAAVALTDHDTVSGLPEAREAAAATPELVFVPGVEISAAFPHGTLHILGLGIDENSGNLAAMLRNLQDARATRNPRILTKLTDLGMPLAMDDVRRAAEELSERGMGVPPMCSTGVSPVSSPVHASSSSDQHRNNKDMAGTAVEHTPVRAVPHAGRTSGSQRILGRLHIALAMVHKGYVSTTAEAFDKYIGSGRPAYVDKERLTPRQSISGIHAAGGLAVLAHPPQLRCQNDSQLLRIVRELLHAGLDGIEAYHTDHDARQTRLYLEIARRLNLGVTGGSDFHGKAKHGVRLGQPAVPVVAMGERFREKLLSR